ncbi:MAG: von Willebrand factor type [Pseudonocardiales bacterium]|nr:von Willebrand factor type [Pseudonocardiales bacterium]
MTLSSPWWLVLGVVVVAALIGGAVLSSRRRRAALASAGVVTNGRRRLQFGLWLSIAGVAVLAFAVAGPAASVSVSRAAGTVIIAMDVSNSMGATDVEPTRLDAAKKAAVAFVDAQPSSVDVGVVAFQSGALTTNQPSADHSQAAAAINRLEVAGGTSLAAAILTSLSAITGKTVTINRDGTVADLGYWGSATIVVFSDGGDEGDGDATEVAATAAQTAGVHIDSVGVGTTVGGTVEVDGYKIQTALDEDTLTNIAKTSGGAYHPASNASELDGIASTINLRLTRHNEDLPLAGAFTAFAIALLAAGGILTVLRTGRIV